MTKESVEVRTAMPKEFSEIGNLLVNVYAQLEGFPKPSEQPEYYRLLHNIGALTQHPEVEIIVARNNHLLGAVVVFYDMKFYGSGGTATLEKNAAGFRLLAVDPTARRRGVGYRLIMECIERTKQKGINKILIHTTDAMKTAWNMYEKIGFQRYEQIDFMQGSLSVFGLKYDL